MNTYRYISSFRKLALILTTGFFIFACEVKEKPVEEIYKAKPIQEVPEKTPEKKKDLLKEDPAPSPPDSLSPEFIITPDSTSKVIQDTTETLDQNVIEKKPEIRKYKRLYLYNLHKKPLIS